MSNPALLLAAGAGLALWLFGSKGRSQKDSTSPPPYRATTFSRNPRFLMFYVDWCPHCQAAKPEFQKLVGTRTLGMTPVDFVMINHETDEKDWVGYDVKGYPTMIYETASGAQIQYTGARNADSIIEFVQRNQ